MIRTAIENAVVAWLVAAGVAGGVVDPDNSVILADDAGPRPAHAYLTVKVIVYDIPVHEDEDLSTIALDEDDEEIAIWQGRGLRTGTVSVNAYGAVAEAWLERATFMLGSPSVLEQLTTAGLTVRPIGGLNNLSALLDTATETRAQRDFSVDYERVSTDTETEAVVELATVEHEDHWDGEPTDRTETVTIEVS